MATRRNEYTFRDGDIIDREEYHDGKYGAKGKKREKKKTPTKEDMQKVNAMNKAKKARQRMLMYFGPLCCLSRCYVGTVTSLLCITEKSPECEF